MAVKIWELGNRTSKARAINELVSLVEDIFEDKKGAVKADCDEVHISFKGQRAFSIPSREQTLISVRNPRFLNYAVAFAKVYSDRIGKDVDVLKTYV